jgi:gluconokinase
VTAERGGPPAAVVVVMGVSGSGKTTVGRALATRLGAEFHDADDYHPQANVAKMRSGVPLTEADRKPWLERLRGAIDAWLAAGTPAVLACSALTARSRATLGTDRDGVMLVFLNGPRELMLSRMRVREHFMPPALLDSQFATLEPPGAAEALALDASLPVETLVARIEAALGSAGAQ